MLEINFFFWGGGGGGGSSNYVLPGIKGSSKTSIPSSKHRWPSDWPLSD